MDLINVIKFSGGLSSGSSYKYFLGQWQQAALGKGIKISSHINYDGLHYASWLFNGHGIFTGDQLPQ